MVRCAALQKALGAKKRAEAVRKCLNAEADASECRTWAEVEKKLEGFAGCVEDVLRLPVVGGSGKADPVLLQMREEFLQYDECKYYALTAAARVLAAALDQADTPATGAKRKAGEMAGAMGADVDLVVGNIIALLHGLPVPKGKKAAVEVKNTEVLSRLRDAAKAEVAAVEGMKAKERNKKQKEGVLQLFTASCYQRAFTDLWVGLFNIPDLGRERLLFLLDSMHEAIIPYLPTPLVLFDFLSDSYEEGGLAGILALNSLFILMIEHGLEFPAFFEKLYQLLTPDVCVMKQRGRFFDLVGKFLGSVGLSAAHLAGFVKRMCRLSLHAPTPAVFFLMTLVKVVLLRNPQLMVLIHRERKTLPDGEEGEEGGSTIWDGVDPYDAAAPKPEESRAIDSSCWELRALLEHFNPTIASTAKELLEELKAPLGGAAPLLTSRAGRTYARMITREVLKDIKTVPTTAYAAPTPFRTEKDDKDAAAAPTSAVAAVFAF
eukprot:TRINITY_DN16257_c0_g1_i1.p1 TRINITY_DN16257_c0_g1~~TRINITY_DN16257_c0_g1_i1.p1  ORF type:complete len:490 (+),score=226.32 TRINITY_DN16257_c0_g1_i1:72-1541(+)